MMTWVMPLLNGGLTIHIANTGQVIDINRVNRDFGSFMTMMSAAFSAYEFSRKQQERGNKAWVKRRRLAQEGENLSRHRARKWLLWNAAQKLYEPIPERVALIKEMFALRLQGKGKGLIAKTLNERALTDPFYAVWISTKRAPKAWTPSAVARIIQDRAVLGYLQYSRYPRGADKRIPLGEPVKVYPAIIDEEVFARANNNRLEEQLRYQGRGRSISNLFGQVATCGECGGRVTALGSSRWRVNKDGSKSQHYFLYCTGAKVAKTCANQRGWTYSEIERLVLDSLLNGAIDDLHFKSDEQADRAQAKVLIARQQVKDQTASAKNILSLVMAGDDLATEEYQKLKAKLDDSRIELQAAERELSAAKGKVSQAEHIVRVSELRQQMDSDDPERRYQARALVKAALTDLIKSMVFSRKGFVGILLVDNLRYLTIKDGKIVGDLEIHKRWPDAQEAILHKRVKGEWVYVGATPDEIETSRAYRRRTS
jgi:hypothetical protein